jgi:lipoprotein NlpI
MANVTQFQCEGSDEVTRMRLSEQPTVTEVQTHIKAHFHFAQFSLQDSSGVAIVGDADLQFALSLDPPIVHITRISTGKFAFNALIP